MDDDEIEPKAGKSGKVTKGPKPPKPPREPAGRKGAGLKLKAGHAPKIGSMHPHVKGKDPGNLFKGKKRGRG